MIRPGEEIHYVALLDESGETIVTIPLREPLECPQRAEDVKCDINLQLTMRGRA